MSLKQILEYLVSLSIIVYGLYWHVQERKRREAEYAKIPPPGYITIPEHVQSLRDQGLLTEEELKIKELEFTLDSMRDAEAIREIYFRGDTKKGD